jgi:curli biogenesis system outer membrane secretion channel CsgG
MKTITRLAPLSCMLAAALLSGCANAPVDAGARALPAPAPAAAAVPAQAPSADQAALRDGIALYNNGDYNAAIKRLGATDITGGAKAIQLAALKYTAFSYCVTSRQNLCRQQFDKAFKLDPAFDLAPGEHGHPLWGPAFARAKKGK